MYVYIRMHMHMHAYTHTYLDLYTYDHICVSVHACMRVHAYVNVYVYGRLVRTCTLFIYICLIVASYLGLRLSHTYIILICMYLYIYISADLLVGCCSSPRSSRLHLVWCTLHVVHSLCVYVVRPVCLGRTCVHRALICCLIYVAGFGALTHTRGSWSSGMILA